MFYLKHKGKKLNIHEDNVYTICPDCGKEHVVDLHEQFAESDFDLYGTAVYCPECAKRRIQARKADV